MNNIVNIAAHLEPEGGAATLDNMQFLAFRLGKEEYGINILKVQELRGYEEPTRLANAPGDIKPPPEIGSALDSAYITGLGTLDNRMVILVDVDKLMSGADLGLITSLAA